jgi:hypothetical protein
MAAHRRELEHYALAANSGAYRTYLRCLADTFGPAYVEHLERWLTADGIAAPNDDVRV